MVLIDVLSGFMLARCAALCFGSFDACVAGVCVCLVVACHCLIRIVLC